MEDTDKQWEIRLVLLGNVGAGKSASGNTLLGVTGFVSRISPNLVTKHCEAQTVTLGERQIMVVDTPGLTATMVTDTAKDKLLHCLQLSAPGPHIFLLVVPVGRFTQEERATMERVVAVFGKRVYKFSIILFTFKDRLKNSSIERFIMSAGDDLQQLVQTCGSRYHAFNNENPGNEDQVGPLLAQIDKLVAANGGRWYTQVTDMEEFDGRPNKQLLDDKKDYEATSKVHETKPGVNKGETKNTENMEFEENWKKREEWVWRQEEQLWKRDERLRALENHLRTSEEQIMKCKEDLHRQIEAERRDRIQEKQEMDRMMKEVENRSHDLKLEKENMDSERKELERQQIHLEAQKEEMRQLNTTKLVIEKEVEELRKKSKQSQTLKRERNAEIKKLQVEKTKLQEELLGLDQQIKRTRDEIERQKSMKERNEREIERQTTQLQEQSTEIQTQNEEIDRQEREIQTNARTIKQTRRKKLILENRVQTEEKELQIKKTELERLKDLHEEKVRLMRLGDEQNKYREMRRREEDLQTLQDIHHQLDTKLSSSNYTPDCNSERDLSVELGNIIEKMKTELLESSEEMEVLINTQEERERRQRKESSEKDDGAAWCSTGTGGQTTHTYKVYETHLPLKIFINTDHSSTQGIIRKSALKGLMEILQHLSLENFYPNKLTTESVLSVGSPKETHSKSNMAFIYLQKLLMQNHRVRFITLRNKENKNKEFILSARTGGHLNRKYGTGVGGAFDAVNDDGSNYGAEFQTIAKGISRLFGNLEEHDHLDEFLSARDDSINAKEKETIHPMDVQMAVYHCADSFLRQYMVTKLSSCQYGLPLLVPSPTSTDIEIPLWTFRQIKKTWKSVGGSSTSLPVCQVKAPMVFFCRLGSVSTSKSQLLNSLINPKHDTFFHRESPGSSRTRLFMEGLVEIAWYCPAGNTDDLFSECTAFCNLHGDAVEHREQTDFLTEQAAVNVVLMQHVKPNEKERELLEKLHKSSKPFIWVVCDLQRGPLKIGHGLNIKIGLGGRNHNELSNDLTSAIKTCLQRRHFSPSFSLEESSDHAKCFGFKVDEDSKDCQEGKTGALKIMKYLEGENISEVKNKFLPCQGKLWHDWSKNNKKLHHLHKEIEHTRNATLTEMNKIRMKQRGNNLRFMKSFVKNLLLNSITQKRYFIQWIRHFIDTKFSDQVSQLHLKYNSKWLEVQKLQNTPGKSEELKLMQEQLEDVSEELDILTFHLEHIFREMGQIYEAWATTPEEMGAEVSALPAVAADLLISGHPLELMDGDAAHVPLTWIESVLEKVTETLGDQRVFVLSVLGLQSSGKSTMLNTMFGLQFAVSAGRCTRGAFMQLIRVKEEVKEELRFDYLLVVDTGGLRSLQLVGRSTHSHDNELVTFVTGLANMTLINILGENPSEMEGILHVIIQAILRMKEVKLDPSCMFVHQNITDITTAEKNMERRLHLQEKLDKMTRSVAKEQDCDVKCFGELVKFNIQTDVHYFAQVWEGNPPMAPPNPHYSESVESLKQTILKAAAQQNCLRLSELKVRIRDLWTAVLNEDFVFSFRNNRNKLKSIL